jgi:hypothetical protein
MDIKGNYVPLTFVKDRYIILNFILYIANSAYYKVFKYLFSSICQ